LTAELKKALEEKGLDINGSKKQLESRAKQAGINIQRPPKLNKAELKKEQFISCRRGNEY